MMRLFQIGQIAAVTLALAAPFNFASAHGGDCHCSKSCHKACKDDKGSKKCKCKECDCASKGGCGSGKCEATKDKAEGAQKEAPAAEPSKAP